MTGAHEGPIFDDFDSAAEGLRRLTDLLMRVAPDDRALPPLAGEIDAILAGLGSAGPVTSREDPAAGRGNAIAPPLRVTVDDDGTVVATTTLGLVYQGPRGLVHGGMSALMLSHVVDVAAGSEGAPAAVEQISVRYHQPTPLLAELSVIAEPPDPADEYVQARIEADGVTRVSARARVTEPGSPGGAAAN